MVPKDIAIKLANNPASNLINNNGATYRVPDKFKGRVGPDVKSLKLEMSKIIHRYKDKYVAIHKTACDQ